MATTHVNIEQQKTIRENVLDVITTISPKDRPALAKFGRQDVTNTTVTWTTDVLDTPSAVNKNNHGFTVTFAAADYTVGAQVSNYTQLLMKQVAVDESMLAVKVAGASEGELNRQKNIKMESILNDLEATIVSNNTGVAPLPNTGTVGVSKGCQSLVSNIIDSSQQDYGRVLSKSLFNSLSRLCYNSGGKPDIAMMGAEAKDAVAGWVQQINRPVSDDGKKLTDVVNQVETTTGFQDLILERNIPTAVLLLESQYFKTGWLRELRWKDVGPTGDFVGGWYTLEATLICLAPQSSGKITGLNYVV